MPVIKVKSYSRIKKADVIYSDEQIRDEIEKIKRAVVEESYLEEDTPKIELENGRGEEMQAESESAARPVYSQEYILSDTPEPLKISMKKVTEKGLPEDEVKKQIQDAYDEGFADGQETTSASFKQQIRQHEQWLRNMDSVVKELRSRYSKEIVNFEESLAELSIMVASHILEREVSEDSQIVVDQVRKAIRSLDEDVIFKIRIHPDNLEILKKVKSSLVSDSSRIENVVLAPDRSVDKGGCILETSTGSVDVRLATQLEKIGQSLKEVSHQPATMKETTPENKEVPEEPETTEEEGNRPEGEKGE